MHIGSQRLESWIVREFLSPTGHQLMYEFCGQLSLRDMEPFERDHYERMEFSRLSKEATALDTKAKTITFSDGSKHEFGKL